MINIYEKSDIDIVIASLLKDDPSGNSYSFCYCGCPASEHQNATGFCFNCDCMAFIPVECEI